MTVITQTDFDFSDNAGIAAFNGGADGDAGLYVSGGGSVPDPPSGAGTEGDYCRGYLVPSGGGGVAFGSPVHSLPWIKSSVESGVFHGAQPTNQAYSLRAWVRIETPDFREVRIGFAMRIDPTVTFGSGSNLGFSGYGMHVGNRGASGSPGARQIYGWANKPTGQTSSVPTVTSSYTADTWVKIRMDVLHLPTVQDTVTYYTGTGTTGSEVWTQIGQSIIPVASDGYNGPGVATNRTCFFAQSEGAVSSDTSTAYIDRFQAIMSIAS